jgi:hypothetical protein
MKSKPKTKPRRRAAPVSLQVVNHLPADVMEKLITRVIALDAHLRDAVARKPNQGLQDLVDAVKQCAYQLKAQRAELDQLAIQLQANTTVVGSLVGRAPKVTPLSLASQREPLEKV